MPGRRTVEDRVALIDEKIAKKQAEIEALEAQKNKLLHPVTMKSVMEKAKAAGLSKPVILYELPYHFIKFVGDLIGQLLLRQSPWKCNTRCFFPDLAKHHSIRITV